ncbi:MAG: peptide deformylase [Bacilli bacterium]
MILMKDIIREGNPILRQKAESVSLPASSEDVETLIEMMDYLYNSQDDDIAEKYGLRAGVGLAAPQIGISKRMIAVLVPGETEEEDMAYALFNPRIVGHSAEMTYLTSGEGCLSVDRAIEGYVPRYARVTVRATTHEGEEITLQLSGLHSIVFQHEIDHLNGIMFFDRISKDDPFKAPENSIALDR